MKTKHIARTIAIVFAIEERELGDGGGRPEQGQSAFE